MTDMEKKAWLREHLLSILPEVSCRGCGYCMCSSNGTNIDCVTSDDVEEVLEDFWKEISNWEKDK